MGRTKKNNENEILWVTYLQDSKPKYLIKSDQNRINYFLYEVKQDETIKKIKTKTDPMFPELYNNGEY